MLDERRILLDMGNVGDLLRCIESSVMKNVVFTFGNSNAFVVFQDWFVFRT